MPLRQGRLRATFCFLAFAVLPGCTGILIESTKPKEVHLGANSVAVKLVSASVLRDEPAHAEEPTSRIYLCLSRTLLPDGPEQSMLVGLRLPYPFTNVPDENLPFHKVGRSKVGDSLVLESDGLDVLEGCETPAGKALVRELRIVEAGGQKLALPEDQEDAIVVSYQTMEGLGIGYISAAPIFGGYRSFTIDLAQTPLYAEHKGARPYLLLLTPITAVGDVILGTALLFTAGTLSAVCAGSANPCP
jgi:hypothetical protein